MAGKAYLELLALLGIWPVSTKEEAPATLPADFFSSKDASVTTVEEAQAAKEDSKGQAGGATPVKQEKPEAFDWSRFGAPAVETSQPRPAAERAGELQNQSNRPTPSPIPSRWVN